MTSYAALRLGDAVLPLTIIRERTALYETAAVLRGAEEAEALLRVSLLQELEAALGDGYALTEEFTVTMSDGVLTVTLTADCMENIAVSRPLTPEEAARLQ